MELAQNVNSFVYQLCHKNCDQYCKLYEDRYTMKQFFHLVFGAGIETINLLVEAYYFNHQTMAPAYYRPYFYSN